MYRFIKLIIVAVLFNMPLFSQEVENKQELHKKCSGSAFVSGERSAEKNRQLSHYDVKHYLLDIEVSPLNTEIKGRVSIQAISVVEGLSTLALELVDTMEVDSVFVEEEKQAFDHRDNMIYVTLNQSIPKDSLFEATIYYKGVSVGRGVTQAYNSSYGFDVTWSLSESFHAKEWWPCKEVLTDKADSATIILTTNKKYKAVSNGILFKTEAAETDKMKYYWKTRFPINYYLISFAVADYREHNFFAPVNESGDSVFVQNFVYNSDIYLDDNKERIEATSELMAIFSELFGSYPYSSEKYGHAISELGGGMEHQTITTLGNFSFLLVAHELAHQWFGDFVTCSSWQDIWINEGFASYGEYLALEFSGQKEEAKEWMKQAHKLAFKEPEGSVYVPFQDINNESRIFNFYLSYKKGASIIHTIRYKLGDDDLFFSVLKGFLQKYKHSNASGEDFMNYLNTKTDKNFNGFFDDWYYGKGYPEYLTKWSRQDDSLALELEQVNSSGEMNVFEIPVELKIISANSDTLIKVKPDSRITEITVYFDDDVEEIIVDPSNWILNKDKHFTPLEKQPVRTSPVRVYPNPFNRYLIVDFSSDSLLQKTIKVRRMDGSLVYSTIVNKNSLRINTQTWPGGVYLLELIENKSHLCIKAIKY